MVLKRAMALICLTTAALGVAVAQESALPATQPSTQVAHMKPRTAKAKAPAHVKPPCLRDRENDSVCAGILPKPARINSGGAQAGGDKASTKLIVEPVPDKFFPFQNDLADPRRKASRGGLVGVEAPF